MPVSVGKKQRACPRVLVALEVDAGSYRIVQTTEGFIVEKREPSADAMGGEEWERVDEELVSLLGPLALEFYNTIWF